MTNYQALELIERASDPSSLFGSRPLQDPAEIYRDLLKLVHPDRFPIKQRVRADAAARKLGELFHKINGKPTVSPVKVGDWVIQGPLAKGNVADLHIVTDGKRTAVLKIARSASDNDLLQAEAKHLRFWQIEKHVYAYARYTPQIIDTMFVGGRAANVLSLAEGCHSLASIKELMPGVLDFRHCVWMVNRTLSLLGYIHRSMGVVHGGILPEHLLFRPSDHGLVVVGWCSAVSEGSIPIMETDRQDFYPKEVLRKQLHQSTDLYMLARCIQFFGNIPLRMQSLVDWCLSESPNARPQDAWELQDTWKARAEEIYGPAKFVKLEIPKQ